MPTAQTKDLLLPTNADKAISTSPHTRLEYLQFLPTHIVNKNTKLDPCHHDDRVLSRSTTEDEARLPSARDVICLSALTTCLSPGTALSASSPTSTLSTRKLPSSPFIAPDKEMPLSRPVHLLIASVGNPPPYHNTRHSAGHILLKALASRINAPPLHKSREYDGLVSSTTTEQGTDWTLFQSRSLMNTSGPTVLKAYKTFTSQQHPRSSAAPDHNECGLVILHDELELEPGKIKTKHGDGSAKGHNGIKSVQQSLQGAGMLGTLGANVVKVGVGIGRPVGRDRDEVSGYVLGTLTEGERRKIEGAAEEVLQLLEKEARRMGM